MERFPDWNKKINPKPEEKKDDEGMSRRKFLRTALLGGGAVALGLYKCSGEKEQEPTKEGSPGSPEPERHPIPRPPEYVPGDDWEAAQHILGKFDLKKIHLGHEAKDNTKSYWYKKYRDNPKLRKSLLDAYNDIEKWKPQLEGIFVSEGVPREFIYLAIPESHWRWEKPSPAGAVGPYQLMEDMARIFGLQVDDEIDERKDVLKSARTAAKLLADLYGRTDSWDLALSGYNGGQIWGYLKGCPKKECSYIGFLGYMEGKINQFKAELARPVWAHTVSGKEETLGQVAVQYGLGSKDLMRVNKIPLDKRKNPIIREGQVINIPTTNMAVKEIIYNKKIGGFIENLNYPGKYHAVIEHVKKLKEGKSELLARKNITKSK